jgi:hypothetical protein
VWFINPISLSCQWVNDVYRELMQSSCKRNERGRMRKYRKDRKIEWDNIEKTERQKDTIHEKEKSNFKQERKVDS